MKKLGTDERFVLGRAVLYQKVMPFLVWTEQEVSGSRKNAFNRGQSLGNEQGHGIKGFAGNEYEQVISTGHQVARFHFIELGYTQGHAIKAPLPFRTDLYLDNGSDFLGPMFRKFDQTAKKSYWWFDNHPVDTFKQHAWVNPFWADDVDEVVELMGADRVIFGSDWPHIEGMPQPLDYLVELKNLDAEQTKRVMLDNVLELNTPQPL